MIENYLRKEGTDCYGAPLKGREKKLSRVVGNALRARVTGTAEELDS